VSDAQISKLIGTTRNTIGAIRERSHWNIQNIQPKDPVTLGLCSQRELDAVVAKAAKRAGVTEDVEAPVKGERNDREKLIEELRAERDATHKAAAEAAQEAEAEAWLAARRDVWTTTGLRDPSGRTDPWLGQLVEGRIHWDPLPANLSLELGVTGFWLGDFAQRAPEAPGGGKAAAFGYLQATISL
jgi:hypothetical protein